MEPVIAPNLGGVIGAIGQLANKLNGEQKEINKDVTYSPEYLKQGFQIGIYAQDQDNYQIGLVYYTEEGLQKVILGSGSRQINSYKDAKNDFEALINQAIITAKPKGILEINKVLTDKGYVLGYDGKQIFSAAKTETIHIMRSEFTKDEKQTSNEADKEKMLIGGMKAYICQKRETALNMGLKLEQKDKGSVTLLEKENAQKHIDDSIQARKEGRIAKNGFEDNFRHTYPVIGSNLKSNIGIDIVNENMKRYLATIPEKLSDNSEYKQYETYLFLREQYSKAIGAKQQNSVQQMEQLMGEFVNSLENETKLKKFYEKLEIVQKGKPKQEDKTR